MRKKLEAMATIKPIVRHIKNDNTCLVDFDLSHKSRHAYIETSLYVKKSDLVAGKKELKKSFYNESIDNKLNIYRKYIADLGFKLKSMTVQELKEYIVRQEETRAGTNIDFIDFCVKANDKIKEEKGENGTYGCNKTAIEWLKKYIKTDTLNINTIKKSFLEDFEKYMRDNGLGTAGISCYMRALRTFFIRAMDKFNDEATDTYPIKHYPFKNYQIQEHIADKRSIETDVMRIIKDSQTNTLREELGKDMFMLTFCLAGIAPIDLYLLEEPVDGYVEYFRNKVKNRNGKIKIRNKVGKEAQIIINKYSSTGFLSDIKRYASADEFARACKMGLKSLTERLNKENQENIKNQVKDKKKKPTVIPNVTLYWARHTFSTIAGELKFDTNLIDFVLGHKPKNAVMAELYITRKQNTVDKLVSDVIKEVYSDKTKENLKTNKTAKS